MVYIPLLLLCAYTNQPIKLSTSRDRQDTEGHTGQLALGGGQDLANRLGGSGRAGDNVARRCTSSTPVLRWCKWFRKQRNRNIVRCTRIAHDCKNSNYVEFYIRGIYIYIYILQVCFNLCSSYSGMCWLHQVTTSHRSPLSRNTDSTGSAQKGLGYPGHPCTNWFIWCFGGARYTVGTPDVLGRDTIHGLLSGSVGVDGGHQTLLDSNALLIKSWGLEVGDVSESILAWVCMGQEIKHDHHTFWKVMFATTYMHKQICRERERCAYVRIYIYWPSIKHIHKFCCG